MKQQTSLGHCVVVFNDMYAREWSTADWEYEQNAKSSFAVDELLETQMQHGDAIQFSAFPLKNVIIFEYFF